MCTILSKVRETCPFSNTLFRNQHHLSRLKNCPHIHISLVLLFGDSFPLLVGAVVHGGGQLLVDVQQSHEFRGIVDVLLNDWSHK